MNEMVYDLLNDMEQNIGQYEDEKLSDMEVKQMMRKFRKIRYKNGGRVPARKLVAAAAIAIVICAGFVFYNPVMAGIQMATYHIQDFLEMDTDVSSYTKAVNSVISKNGVVVSLDEVIVDEDCLHIIYSARRTDSKKGSKKVSIEGYTDVGVDSLYVNGVNKIDGTGAGSMVIDGDTVYVMDVIFKDMDVNKENHYKIGFVDENFEKIGSVSFVATGKELMASRKRTKINRDVTLEDGGVLHLDELVTNPVQFKINVSMDMEDCESMGKYEISLKGHDNLGREMEFYMADWDINKGRMILFMGEDNVDMSGVTSFTVAPYSQEYPEGSGELKGEPKRIGEPFTITW